MTAQDPARPSEPAQVRESVSCTLEPLATEGPDAISPDTTQGILEVKLNKLQLAWDNLLHDVTTYQADDVFHSPVAKLAHIVPIPPGVKLTGATFLFRCAHTTEPDYADIHPPDTVRIKSEKNAPLIASWLLTHHFLRSSITTLSQFLAILVLAFAASSAPAPWDDTDDSDSDDERHPISALP